jgi:PAS domain S-box-containing protein
MMKKKCNPSSTAKTASYLEEVGNILETTRKPFLIFSEDHIILFANQRFYDTFACAPEQIENHPFYSVLNEEWNIPSLRHLLETVPSKVEMVQDDYEFEHVFPRLGRKILQVNAQRTFLAGLGRNVLLLSIEDYTQRKLQAQRLVESEKRFRRLFETSHDGLLLVNKKTGAIAEVNGALTELLGETREEIVGKQIQESGIIGEEWTISTLLNSLADTGFHAFDNVLINLKTSLPFNAQVTVTNRSEVLQFNVRNISERILEKNKLQRSLDEWQTTFDAIPELITVLDRNMQIIRSNKAFNEMFGGEPGDYLGRHCYEVFPGQTGPCPGCPSADTLTDFRIHSNVITTLTSRKHFRSHSHQSSVKPASC